MNQATTNFQLAEKEFLILGLRDLAYVRPTALNDGEAMRTVYAIHTADGTPIGAAETRDLAFAAVRQNGLEPVSTH